MRNNNIYKAIQLLGLTSASIGALTICGYWAGQVNLYTWGGNIGMALSTAVTFVLQGVAIYILAKQKHL